MEQSSRNSLSLAKYTLQLLILSRPFTLKVTASFVQAASPLLTLPGNVSHQDGGQACQFLSPIHPQNKLLKMPLIPLVSREFITTLCPLRMGQSFSSCPPQEER